MRIGHANASTSSIGLLILLSFLTYFNGCDNIAAPTYAEICNPTDEDDGYSTICPRQNNGALLPIEMAFLYTLVEDAGLVQGLTKLAFFKTNVLASVKILG